MHNCVPEIAHSVVDGILICDTSTWCSFSSDPVELNGVPHATICSSRDVHLGESLGLTTICDCDLLLDLEPAFLSSFLPSFDPSLVGDVPVSLPLFLPSLEEAVASLLPLLPSFDMSLPFPSALRSSNGPVASSLSSPPSSLAASVSPGALMSPRAEMISLMASCGSPYMRCLPDNSYMSIDLSRFQRSPEVLRPYCWHF
ncbi:hypothetical protein KCU81_g740, partial [Aureobasidium melanogenum]